MGKKINYKSDFVLRERFRDGGGRLVSLPDVDFTLQYWTRAGKIYEASRKGEEWVNCVADGDALLVVFKDHGLHEGTLKRELHLSLDNALMSDGRQEMYYVDNSEIELWHLSGTEDGVVESELVAAYTRGYRFTWDDFTDENKAELTKPATEAAADCEKRTTAAVKSAGEATDSATKAAAAAAQATEAVQKAQEATEAATKESKSATEAAKKATEECDSSKKACDEATALSEKATEAAEKATEETEAATEKAQTATDYATKSGQQAATAAEELEATRQQLEELTARAEKAAREIPTGLNVEAPTRVTIGNTATQYVRARVKPDSALQNVVMLTDGASVKVEPDGAIVAVQSGTTRVHVIPTAGVAYYKTIEIETVMPRLRLAGSAFRLDGKGNIRLT